MAEERVQKILAQAGLGSRRSNETLIRAGRVYVNGRKIKLGERADADTDEIRVDGRVIKAKQDFLYIAVNKPRGVLSTTVSTDGRKTILDLTPHEERLYPVGRLDAESEGLMLLTNDGEFTQRMTHPRFAHEKEYRVLVARQPNKRTLEAWRKGVLLADGFKTAPARVWVESEKGKGAWLRVVLTEGHKRQIRETARSLGLPVVSLIRVRMGTLELGSLKAGKWRELNSNEVSKLLKVDANSQ